MAKTSGVTILGSLVETFDFKSGISSVRFCSQCSALPSGSTRIVTTPGLLVDSGIFDCHNVMGLFLYFRCMNYLAREVLWLY